MADYIDIDTPIDVAVYQRNGRIQVTLRQILESNDAKYQAADVREVVKAHWYWDKDGMDWGIGAWRCSACNTKSPMWWNCDRGSPMHKSGHRFCPNCGCAMEDI